MSEYEINELKVQFVNYINVLADDNVDSNEIGNVAFCVSGFINYLENKNKEESKNAE